MTHAALADFSRQPTPHQRRPHRSAESPHLAPPVKREATHQDCADHHAVCPLCEQPMMQCQCEFTFTLEQLEASYCTMYPAAAKYELQAKMELA